MWQDILIPLIVAAIAVLWPWLLALQRGWRFRRLIRRELAEIGPYPVKPAKDTPWWDHACKRFVHQEILRTENVTANRDFILSLDPTLVYQVSQLWIALETRDGNQWRHYLGELAKNRSVYSKKLQCAVRQWNVILKEQRKEWLDSMGMPTSFRKDATLERAGQLFERRAAAYASLTPLLDFGPEGAPRRLVGAERRDLVAELRGWFYKDGSGLLLSGRAHAQFWRFVGTLAPGQGTHGQVRDAASALRTDLKIDLGVRQPQERGVELSWPEEERW